MTAVHNKDIYKPTRLSNADRPVMLSELPSLIPPVTGFLPLTGGILTGALTLASDPTLALQAATKQYVDNSIIAQVVGLWDDRGNYDASVNLYPSTGGSGITGAILKGDVWTVSVAGTLGGTAVQPGDTVRALVDTPSQVAGNWAIGEHGLGYSPLSSTLNSGLFYLGNASNLATAVAMSGDGTMDNTGALTLATVSIAKGGTNSSTALISNRMMVSVGGAIVEHSAQTSGFVAFYTTGGLPAGDSAFRWNNTTKRLGIGVAAGGDKLSITATGTERGIFVSSAVIGGYFSTTSSSVEALSAENSGTSITPVTTLLLTKAGHVATIGSGSYISWDDKVPINAVIGNFGVITTDITAGTYKTAFVWRTPNETDGTLIERMRLTSAGLLGLGNTPTAVADLSASSTTRASLRLRSGIAPTAPNLGDCWYDGTDFLIRTTTRNDKIARILTGSATLNFPSTAGFGSSDLTITVTGAAIGDCVALGTTNPSAFTGSSYTAWVSAVNTVTVRFINSSLGAKDPASATFKVTVFKNI